MKSGIENLRAAEAAYRHGKFDEADAAYLKIKQIAPTHVTALERLGTIALWNNRIDEAAAARFFREAAGPVPIGPFRTLSALGNWLASFGETQPYLIEGPNETRLNFVVTDPLPVVEVSVNGAAPIHCIIDTGGSEIILDQSLAQTAGAQITATMTGEFGGAKKAAIGLGRVDSIKLAEFTLQNMPVHTLNLASISAVFNGLEIKGIIGTRLLMHFLSTIDYPNGGLILRRATPENLARLEAHAEAQKAKRIPFWLIETHYIVAWGTVNGVGPTLFFVDTGLAGKGFIPSNTLLKKAQLVGDWSKAEESIGGGGTFKTVPIVIDELTLGAGLDQIVKHNVSGFGFERQPVLGNQLGFEIGGLISPQFFRDHAVTFDFKSMYMILH
ncbi:MAG: aspartyl protease family protein [bacterium]